MCNCYTPDLSYIVYLDVGALETADACHPLSGSGPSFQDDFEIVEVHVFREEGLAGEYDPKALNICPASSSSDQDDDMSRRGSIVKTIRFRTSHVLGPSRDHFGGNSRSSDASGRRPKYRRPDNSDWKARWFLVRVRKTTELNMAAKNKIKSYPFDTHLSRFTKMKSA